MSVVFEAVAFGSARREGEDGVAAIKRLDGGFLVHAEDGSIDRGLEVEADDVGGLGFEIRVVAGLVSAQTMGLETGLRPDPCDPGLIGSQSLGQFPAAPVGNASRRLSVESPVDDTGLELLSSRGDGPALVAAEETGKTVFSEAIPPEDDRIHAAVFLSAYLPQRESTSQGQNDSGPATVFASSLPAFSHGVQFSSFWRADHKGCCHAANITQHVSELNDSLH